MLKAGELLYPHVCPFCGKVCVEEVCEKCRKKLKSVQEPVCKKCGKPIREMEAEYCGDCAERLKQGICWYDAGRSLWVYRPPVSGSIHLFKSGNRRVYAEYYAQQWEKRYGKLLRKWRIQALIPIPMYRKKQRQRGFNQAGILAKELGRMTGIPVCADILIRTYQPEAQKKLSREQRLHNAEGSFKIADRRRLPGRVLLVDDIYTTGNTMNEAAKILKKAGVKAVFFLTISIGQDI